jgi:hypothetical protein
MKEVDDLIISSIRRITGNEYFKQLFLRQSKNCFSARSAKEHKNHDFGIFCQNWGALTRYTFSHLFSPWAKNHSLFNLLFFTLV